MDLFITGICLVECWEPKSVLGDTSPIYQKDCLMCAATARPCVLPQIKIVRTIARRYTVLVDISNS